MSIAIKIDPTNPGQYYACCGLLELASRLWHGGEGWFEGEVFHFAPAGVRAGTVDSTAGRLLRELAQCRMSTVDSEEKADKPVYLHEPFGIRIDWFDDGLSGGKKFKTWSGQQTARSIAGAMKRPLSRGWDTLPPERWLTQRDADHHIPYYFDADVGGQGSAQDVGFSSNPLGMSQPQRPLLELAAFIGLQRFRPFPIPDVNNRYRYTLWPIPLTPEVAAPAACGMMVLPGSKTYEFALLYRTKYLTCILPANPER